MAYIFITNNPLYAEHSIDGDSLNELLVISYVLEKLPVYKVWDENDKNNGSCWLSTQKKTLKKYSKNKKLEAVPSSAARLEVI